MCQCYQVTRAGYYAWCKRGALGGVTQDSRD